jgi:transposase
MATTKATQPSQKPQKTSSYACHICGLNGDRMTNRPKLLKCKRCFMENMWQ